MSSNQILHKAVDHFFDDCAVFEFNEVNDSQPYLSVSAHYISKKRELERNEARQSLQRLQANHTLKDSSCSHSDGHVLTIGVRSHHRIRAVGVDIEKVGRAVSTRSANRFIHSSEKVFLLSPLDLWVIKEACFKADPHNENQVISRYRVVSYSWNSQEGMVKTPFGKEILFKAIDTGEWKIALAKVELTE